MESKITFGVWETVALLINAICARIFLNFSRNIIEVSGTAGWIQTIYISILALLAFFIIERLYINFQGKDIIDISELAGGNVGRVIVGLLFTLQLIFIGSVILREYTENIKAIALPTSPISFITSFLLAGAACGAYIGIEGITRFHVIVIPIILITFLFIIIAVNPYYDFTRLFPLLGNGLDKIFISGFLSLSTFAPLLYLFLVPPFIKTHKNFRRAGYIGLLLSSFFLICSTFVYSLVVNYPVSREFFLPIFQLARLINYGSFFQRIESVFILSWAVSALMYLSVILFFSAYVFKKTFKLEYYRPLIVPLITIIYTLSLTPPNLMTSLVLETKYYTNFAWAFTFALTTLVLLIAKSRKA